MTFTERRRSAVSTSSGFEVKVERDFGAEGEPATNVRYKVKVAAEANEAEMRELLSHTDRVAEVQNTLRSGTPVTLSSTEIVGV